MKSIKRHASSILLSVLITLSAPGCGSGGGGGGGGASTFEGTIAASDGKTGVLQITLPAGAAALTTDQAAAGASSVTGTLTLADGGGVIELSGSYDSGTGDLTLTGGGYAFTGSVGKGEISGTFTGPGGSTGGFTGLDSTTSTVTTYCGTFSSSEETGVFNTQASSNGDASGTATNVTGPRTGLTVLLSGTITGNVIDLVTSEGVHIPGTVSGTTVSGSFIGKSDLLINYTGSTSGCE